MKKTGSDYVKAFKQRMRADGYVEKKIWVRNDYWPELFELIKEERAKLDPHQWGKYDER